MKSTPAVPFAKLIPYPVPEVLFNVFTVNVDPAPSTLKVNLLVSLAYIPVGALPVLFMTKSPPDFTLKVTGFVASEEYKAVELFPVVLNSTYALSVILKVLPYLSILSALPDAAVFVNVTFVPVPVALNLNPDVSTAYNAPYVPFDLIFRTPPLVVSIRSSYKVLILIPVASPSDKYNAYNAVPVVSIVVVPLFFV